MTLFYVEFKVKKERISVFTAIRGHAFNHVKRILKKENGRIYIIKSEVLG